MKSVMNIISAALGRQMEASCLFDVSPYLQNDKVREWLGYMMLRRIGPLEMTHGVEISGAHVRLMRELFRPEEIGALIAVERRLNPQVDAWFEERHVSTYTAEDLSRYPQGSLGGLLYRRVAETGYQVDLGAGLPLETDFDLWIIRGLQLHDPEHLLCGGGFDLIGEIMPVVMRNACISRHLSPALAQALNAPTLMLVLSSISSAALYYHEALPILMDRFIKAWQIGWSSEPYFLRRLEDVYHLPVEEARRHLDIRGADDVDTTAVSQRALSGVAA